MKRIVFISFILIMMVANSTYCQQAISLSEGTILRVRLLETLDSRISKNGDMVNLEASEDLVVNGFVVVKKGAKVTGMVTDASAAGIGGKKGSLNLSIDYVQAVSGKNIKLRYASSSSGKSRSVGVVAAAVVVNPLLILIKGKSVTIEKDKEFSVYVDKDYEFNEKDFVKTPN